MTVKIDGRYGEGGGQIVRTAVALSALTGQPIELTGIRQNRRRPGLAPQHLTAVRAAASLCGADVAGAQLRSKELRFTPRHAVAGGDYCFDIGQAQGGGSAGSVTLLLQTLLPPLIAARGNSRLVLRGGTHVPWSPSFDYIDGVWLPVLRSARIRAEVGLRRWGWFPAGQGEMACTVAGDQASSLAGVDCRDRGLLQRISGRSVTARLPLHISERMRVRAAAGLAHLGIPVDIRTENVEASCPGAGIFLTCEYDRVRAGFSSLGQRGKASEQVADEVVAAVLEHHGSGAAVDQHLADQILVPLMLAPQGSRFTTSPASSHLKTNAWVISKFGCGSVELQTLPTGVIEVSIRPTGRDRTKEM
jgi:RNA 3'-terminal phosphate cyclase (ATP)